MRLAHRRGALIAVLLGLTSCTEQPAGSQGSDAQSGVDASSVLDASPNDTLLLDADPADRSATDLAQADGGPGDLLRVDIGSGDRPAEGPCSTAEQCDPGLGCRSATGECASCRVASECRSGEACVLGDCLPCDSALECSGGLCERGVCLPCEPVLDDARCAEDYGDARYQCRADGTCAPRTCTAGVDCQAVGQVCGLQGICVDCADSFDCLDELRGGYPAGSLCIDGSCFQANCEDDAACPEDRPICGDDYRCRRCQHSDECLQRHSAEDGYLCDPMSGRCQEGDCYPPGVACGTSGQEICAEDFLCGACSDDAQCRFSLAMDEGVCLSAFCEQGCVAGSLCEQGQVCGDDHRCRPCAADFECAQATGYERSVCEEGVCVSGCEAAGPCDADRVCGRDHRCADCSSNASCSTAYSANYLCIGGHCSEAECNDDRPCGPGLICDADLYRCRSCLQHDECETGEVCDLEISFGSGRCVPGECTRATQEELCTQSQLCDPITRACVACDPAHPCGPSVYGQQRVCDGVACVVGVCTTANQDRDCPATRLCNDLHQCLGCYSLDACGAGRICDLSTHACLVGDCLRNEHCAGGQICTLDRSCRACGDDRDCTGFGYPDGTICEDGLCLLGCTSHGQCGLEQGDTNLCEDGRCRYCDEDSDCQTLGRQAQCAENVSGVGLGVCVDGDCALDADCQQDAVCPPNSCCERRCVVPLGDTSHRCVTAFLPGGEVCDDGNACTVGETCDGANDCRGGQPWCAPDPEDDCAWAACVGSTCVVSVKDGTCYIDGDCYADSYPDSSSFCQECASGNKKKDWTVIDNDSCGEELGLVDVACNTYACDDQGACLATPRNNPGTTCTDDLDPCTIDACNASGVCTHDTRDDLSTCPSGKCCSGICRVGAECCAPGDCDDSNNCTANNCLSWRCSNPAITGSECTLDSQCDDCVGTSTSCSERSMTSCPDRDGCRWFSSGTCLGPEECQFLSCRLNYTSCKACGGGCLWIDSSSCKGTPSPCSLYSDSSSCVSQDDCNWRDQCSQASCTCN